MSTMMNRRLFLLLAPLVFSSLTGCSYPKGSLTYGTYISQDLNSLKVLSNSELIDKAKNDQETFLLAVYQGQTSKTCECWTTFENIIVSYMNKYHENVYLFNAQEQNKEVASLKIKKVSGATPYLYVYKRERQIASFCYKNKQDLDIFEDTTCKAMYDRVHSFVVRPHMYYVDERYLDNNLASQSELSVLFMRSGCGDCSYVLPNVIISYINCHILEKDIWLFDMQELYDLKDSETASEEEKAQYQNIKNKYGLSVSSNATYGYQEGVFPTIQYYENGEIKDATVYFNDVLSQRDDNSFYISDSYYSEERLNNLAYLKGASFVTVLKGMNVEDADVMATNNGGHYWSQKAAAKYHTPILKAFLDHYINY